MAKRQKARRTRRHEPSLRILRPALWSSLIGVVASAAISMPAYADPPLPNTVPDTGARPIPSGPLQLPGGQTAAPPSPGSTATSGLGPFAAQIQAKETQVATLGEQLLALRQEQARTATALQEAEQQLQDKQAALRTAEQEFGPTAAEALKSVAELPPGLIGSDLHQLGALLRIQKGQQRGGDSEGAARDLLRAQAAEQQARSAHAAAAKAAQTARTRYTTAETGFRKQEAELLGLKRRNADKLAALEREREAAERQLRPDSDGEIVGGSVANPRALAAVRFARAQLGKPYEWAAEGPDRYDCSGLIWAAYRSRGADYDQLPRVSRDQYNATRGRTVDRSALLPGDLVFFASGSSWTTIHHMGMYIGDGKMIHAPSTGDVVKISTVWWSRFYAATRVIPAVPAPSTSPPASPATPSSPPATPPTSPTPPPRPTPTPTRPSPTPTSPKPSPTPTTPSPAPTPTPSPSQTSSSGATATPTPSESATGS